MQILIENNEETNVILTHSNFKNMNKGLIAQVILELEILKQQLLRLYVGEEDEN